MQLKSGHQLLELPEDFGVIALFLTLKLPMGSQESFVRGDVFRLPFLPVLVLEVVVNLFQGIGSSRHRGVIAVVKNVELVGGQQLFKHPLILVENMFDQHVRLFDQSADRRFVATGPKPAVVLEDLERLRIAEELTKEPQLPDRLVRHAGVNVGGLHRFVDDRPLVAAFEHPAHLALVILSRIEPVFSRNLRQFLVGT